MIRLLKFLPFTAVLVGTAILASPAQAGFSVRYSTDGGATFTTVNDNAAGDTNLASGNIQVDLTGVTIHASFIGSESPTDTLFDLGVNGSGLKGALNLVVQGTVTDINTAPKPQTLTYDFGGSVSSKAVGVTQKFETWVDDNNVAFGGAPGVFGANVVADTGNLSVPASGSIGFSADPLYSATAQIAVTVTSSTGNYSISNDSNNEITAAVAPAPSSVVLALVAAPLLGFGAWMRRRRTLAIASV